MSEIKTSSHEDEVLSNTLATMGASPCFTHPDDVLSDPRLGAAEKEAILASWCSDARSVENAPELRRLDNGAVVEVEAILRALISLDGPDAGRERSYRWSRAAPTRRGVISRWSGRLGWRNGANDDDDDPPPAPAGLGGTFRPTFVAAHGAPPERLRGLARAAG